MNTSGFVALALVVLWLAYYVPSRVALRQDAMDAQLSDRFSASLRVLAVGGGARVPRFTDVPQVPALGAASPRALITSATLGGDLPGATQNANILMSESTSGSSVSGRSATPAPRRPRSAPKSPSRIALLERRAAAARRRLTITVLLTLLSIGVWVAVGMSAVPVVVGIVPTVVLAGVLVLGRRAVVSARQADAVWAAERRERAAVRAARGVTGGPVEPRNSARVTGLAVHGSHLATQMIPRVTPDMVRTVSPADGAATPAGSSTGDRADEEPVRGSEPRSSTPTPAPASAKPQTAAPQTTAPRTAASTATSTGSSAAAADPAAPATSSLPWDPVPVPRPTYTMKASAPRREPAPMPASSMSPTAPPSSSMQGSSRAQPSSSATPSTPTAPPGVSVATAQGGAPTSAEGPSTETLGLDLNEILARRRAVGE